MIYIQISCPVCLWSKPLERRGTHPRRRKPIIREKGRLRFDVGDLESIKIVQERDQTQGFKTVGGLTLREMAQTPEYKDLVEQLRTRCKEVLEILDKPGDASERAR